MKHTAELGSQVTVARIIKSFQWCCYQGFMVGFLHTLSFLPFLQYFGSSPISHAFPRVSGNTASTMLCIKACMTLLAQLSLEETILHVTGKSSGACTGWQVLHGGVVWAIPCEMGLEAQTVTYQTEDTKQPFHAYHIIFHLEGLGDVVKESVGGPQVVGYTLSRKVHRRLWKR